MIKKFNKFEEGLLVASLAIMVALIFWQVLGRYIFQSAPSWTEEAARYIHVFQVWIGAGYAIKLREHIRVSAFIDLFHGTIRKVLEFTATVIWFVLAVILAILGTSLVLKSMQNGQVSPAIQIPFWIPFLAIPIGGLSMSIRLIQQLRVIARTDYRKGDEVSQ